MFQIRWGTLVAIEPDIAEVAIHAAALANAYNDPHNSRMLGHTEPLEPDDVSGLYAEMRADGDHPFLLFDNGALAGDGDLRNVSRRAAPRSSAAELAFLIAAPSTQGKGLGTRFATMLLAFAFGPLALDRVYASVAPYNPASRRVFDKLGFSLDASTVARAYADEPDDLVLAIDRATFAHLNHAAMAAISSARR